MVYLENELIEIKLPEVYLKGGRECYLDPFRKKMIYITPEEKVRQQIASYFNNVLLVPYEMILLEQKLSYYGVKSKKRADIIIHKTKGDDGLIYPCAIIECKEQNLIIDDKAIKQAIEYANELFCDYLFITNGIDIVAAKYDEIKNEYIELDKLPTYEEMINGIYQEIPPMEVPPRIEFSQLEKKSYTYVGQEFGTSTPEIMLPFLTNIWECFLDLGHTLPQRKYKNFDLIKDYGNRILSYGNASGGIFAGVYRSFIIKYNGNDEFVSIGFSTYSTYARPDDIKTCLNVAIDNERMSHHSLQLVVDDYLSIEGSKYQFTHSGRIGISNKGSGKIEELKKLILKKDDTLLKDGNIHLGIITNNELLYVDTPEVVDFIENLISYALIRDEYREYVLSKY